MQIINKLDEITPVAMRQILRINILGVLLGCGFAAAAADNNTPPQEMIHPDQSNLGNEVVTFPAPPAGFDPLQSNDADLAYYGFPSRPDQQQDPNHYAQWHKMVSVPKQWIPLQVVRTIVRHSSPKFLGTNGKIVNNAATLSYNSLNWSGYANLAANGTFASNGANVSAQIAVPTVSAVSCNNTWEYSSEWVGFDGFDSNDVLQAGVGADALCYNKKQYGNYNAWIEWYPNNSLAITNLAIHPGDAVDVQVTYNASSSSGTIYFDNYTTGVAGSIGLKMPNGTTYMGNSAEWVLERPEVNGSLATLPSFVADTFTNAQTQSASRQAYPSSCSYCTDIYDIDMVNTSNAILSQPTLNGTSTIIFTP